MRTKDAMPVAFTSGLPYFYNPMTDKYEVGSNKAKIPTTISEVSGVGALRKIYDDNPMIGRHVRFEDIVSAWKEEGSPNTEDWMLEQFDEQIGSDYFR